MKFEASHEFACSVDALFDIFEGEALDAKVRALSKSKRELLEDRRDDDGVKTRRWRITPARELPAFVKKMLGGHALSYVQHSRSDRARRRIDWSIDIERDPGRVDVGGHLLIEPSAKGCVRTVYADVQVRLPMVGSRIEKQIVGDLERTYLRSAKLVESLVDA